MPKGVYERRPKHKKCEKCAEEYILFRAGSDWCKKCRKKESDATYARKAKPWTKVDPEHKRRQDRLYYERHREEARRCRRGWYEKNRGDVLKKAEIRRRNRGERPAGDFISGPEHLFIEMLEAVGLLKGRDYEFRARIGLRTEADFLFTSQKLVVELMGEYHRRPIRGGAKLEQTNASDQRRRQTCRNLGLRLVEVPVYGASKKSLKKRTEETLREALRFVRVRTDKMPEDCIV